MKRKKWFIKKDPDAGEIIRRDDETTSNHPVGLNKGKRENGT